MNKLIELSAVIPAAGKSTRMGKPKIILPWEKTTIIGKIISTLFAADIQDIIVVIDPKTREVIEYLNILSNQLSFRLIEKTEDGNNEMLSSIQTGLRAVDKQSKGVIVALADQPQIQVNTVNLIIAAFIQSNSKIVVPSFEMHRGHPWLIDSKLINPFLKIVPPKTARDFFENNNSMIQYVEIENESILQDIDTPTDYFDYLSNE